MNKLSRFEKQSQKQAVDSYNTRRQREQYQRLEQAFKEKLDEVRQPHYLGGSDHQSLGDRYHNGLHNRVTYMDFEPDNHAVHISGGWTNTSPTTVTLPSPIEFTLGQAIIVNEEPIPLVTGRTFVRGDIAWGPSPMITGNLIDPTWHSIYGETAEPDPEEPAYDFEQHRYKPSPRVINV